MKILDGKEFAKSVRISIKTEVKNFLDRGLRPPGLAVIIVGNNPASQTYVNSKEKNAKKVLFNSIKIEMDESITETELLDKIEQLNGDNTIDGILVQLPLPKHISDKKVIEKILPEKDVDGFHHLNMGKLFTGVPNLVPCTPLGIIELLKHNGIEISGKNVVIVGRSNIVGKPLVPLFLAENGTVSICHSKTENLAQYTKMADILVAAVGKPEFIKADMVKNGVIVVDVGINSIEDKSRERGYRLVGDVDFDEVSKLSSYITPVPGGVGPVTIAMLLKNTLLSYKSRLKL